jgi:predicted N-formylglutamate amidohydrolase
MDGPAYHIVNADAPGDFVLTCDHASNRVPACVGNGSLGLPPEQMQRHIAYDIGAAGVVRALSDALEAPAILSDFSRLVIDPNRDPRDPTVLMRIYDGTVVPANAEADAAEKARRLAAFHAPYHEALAALLWARPHAAIVAVHSFTPRLRGREVRPWHIGILHAHDERLSDALVAHLRPVNDIVLGVNEPYTGHLRGDSMDRHCLSAGRHHTLIELRQDLISEEEGQRRWAARLAPVIRRAWQDVKEKVDG